tara:strand:+ start:7727 stop:8056 length:330 start_codon:yes stop_codon:yes gene_type:complete
MKDKLKVNKIFMDKAWYDYFVDFVQESDRNMYNKACDYADRYEYEEQEIPKDLKFIDAEKLPKTEKWENIADKVSKVIMEAIIFGVVMSVFLLIASYVLWKFLQYIYGV